MPTTKQRLEGVPEVWAVFTTQQINGLYVSSVQYVKGNLIEAMTADNLFVEIVVEQFVGKSRVEIDLEVDNFVMKTWNLSSAPERHTVPFAPPL